MRRPAQDWLSEAGYRVREVAPGGCSAEAQRIFVDRQCLHAKHAGAQLVREVQGRASRHTVIAISGQFCSGLSAAGATARCSVSQRVLAKPLTRGDLLEAVRAIIGARG